MEHNGALPDEDITQVANVRITTGKYKIISYKGGNIRIYKDGSKDAESNSKEVLRAVDNEYGLELEDKAWTQTQKAGKAVLKKLNGIIIGE
jgi:hypothetical protein